VGEFNLPFSACEKCGLKLEFQGCSIVREEQEVLFHDCDTKGGSSGGPIIGLVGGESQGLETPV
jgi:hypothetical protein